MSSDPEATAPVRSVGRYRVFDELGRGAMGVVYRGFDPVIGRTVALKTLSIGAADPQAREFRDRLYREAAAAGALSHPNIVTIFDIVEDQALTAVAMEFIEGRSLAAIIADRAPLPLDVAIEVLDQICSALDFAGSQGIVHRDIKPANILLTSGGRAKVTDFGVARLALSTMTQAGTVLGSPSYMSPEQVRGESLDGRSDLFSAAVVFFEMITRERPFAGNDIATTMYRIAHEPPMPPSRFNAAIGAEVATVLDRAFAKDPVDRFQTGADFVAELRAATSLAPRAGTSAALVALASAPPPVPPVVSAASTAGSMLTVSPGPSTPAVLPIPLTGSPTPAVVGGDGQVLAPIPGFGPVAVDALSDPVPSGLALPVIPVPPPGGPATAPRPLVAAGGKRRIPVVALLGGAAALAAVAGLAGFFWLRGDTGPQAPESAPIEVRSTPATPAPEAAVPGPGSMSAPPVAPAPSESATPAPAAADGRPGAAAPAKRASGPSPSRIGAKPAPVRVVPAGTPPAAPAGASSSPASGGTTSPPVLSGGRTPGRVYQVTEVDARPSVVRQVPPLYPDDALAQRVQDTVILQVLVGPAGSAEEIRVLRGSRKAPSLNDSAVAAVRQWVFDPARKGGRTVSCWYNVGVPFEPPR